MIVYYHKKTGEIVGTTEGRIHTKDHLNMWIGDKKNTERVVVQWKAIKEYKDEKGNVIAQDFAPDSSQADIYFALDKNPSDIFKYKVDVKTKELVALK